MAVKLSPLQAQIIRDARNHTVNGRITKRVHFIKGSKTQTWCKLYDLGLICAPHEYADLTVEGVDAQQLLLADPAAKVHPAADGRRGGKAARFDQVPTSLFRVQVTNESGSYPITLRAGTTLAEAEAEYNEQVKLAVDGELVELLADGEVVRHRRKTTVSPLPCSTAAEIADRLRVDAAQRIAADLDVPTEILAGCSLGCADTEHVHGCPNRPMTRTEQIASWVAAGRLPADRPDYGTVSDFMDAVKAACQPGQRVTGKDTGGLDRTGRVLGGDASFGYVTNPDHANHGRVYVQVAWDTHPVHTGAMVSNRIFLDELTRLDEPQQAEGYGMSMLRSLLPKF